MTGAILLAAGVDVSYSRKDDRFIELADRAKAANELGVDCFLSIHCNSADSPARGFEVFTTPGQTISDPFATELFKAYALEFPTLPKRIDDSDGDPDKEASFAVLRLSRMAAALFELDFISVPAGEADLGNSVIQSRMAKALAAGVLAHLRISGADPIKPEPAVAVFPHPSSARLIEIAEELKTLAGQA